MSVKVDEKKCDGCGRCVEMCPMDILRLDKRKKPYVKYNECWYCGVCEIECPRKALTMELPYLIS